MFSSIVNIYKILFDQARQAQERERRRKEKEEALKAMSPAEQLAEKIRIQKIKEESDLQIASELLGVTPPPSE